MSPRPMVSCLLCTRDRRSMVRMAIDSYLSQSYAAKELVVVDDGEDSIYDLVRDIPGVVVPHLERRVANLSIKRNIGIRAARGEYVAHFDDDDWSAPGRIAAQVDILQAAPLAEITGYKSSFWFDRQKQQASFYSGPAWGATFMYRRSYALNRPWNEGIAIAEDDAFLRPAKLSGGLIEVAGGDSFVATLHQHNLPRPVGVAPFWPVIPAAQLPEAFRRAVNL